VRVNWYKDTLEISTGGKGMVAFTDQVAERLQRWGIREGMCYLYIQHTSASLVISENYDPTAQEDMEAFMDRLAP
jgi:secondary thiamine-phosphate synthase enzyme